MQYSYLNLLEFSKHIEKYIEYRKIVSIIRVKHMQDKTENMK